MYWINGNPAHHLSLTDRAIHYGDGFFTTARVRAGQIDLLPYHLDRLAQACDRLLFPSPDWQALTQEMLRMAQQQPEGVLKVIISRGSGGRGYSFDGCLAPLRIIATAAIPSHYALWRERGVALTLSPVRLGCNPLLAGIKHLNRLEQVLIRAHLEKIAGADDAVVLNLRGDVAECCAANIFWRRGTEVYTPGLAQAGVAGVMRRHIMTLLDNSPFHLHEVEAGTAALIAADEAMVCNSLMPVLPVNCFDDRIYGDRTLFDFLSPNC
jgi:4-amino-4-deoxychorismate lyase